MNILIGFGGESAAAHENEHDERPQVPLYYDALACALCGHDGHAFAECPLLQALRDEGDSVERELAA